jgi:2-haloacid dehalogenase
MPGMPPRPSVVVFDVNETLSDLTPLGDRFADLGLPAALAPQWFAAVLRDGFALAVHGESAPFATIGAAVLRTLLTGRDVDADAAVEHVLSGFLALPVHPDVPAGVRALRAAGLRLVTLSNGAAAVAEQLLAGAGLREEFEAVLTVEDAGVWKPAAAAYRHAAQACGVDVSELLLVAVHPWDLDGAARAGLSTAWLDRAGSPWPGVFRAPTHTVPALTDLAAALSGAPVPEGPTG